MITIREVREARDRIDGFVRQTPVLIAKLPTTRGEVRVALKLEQTQVSGTFKARGSFNAILHLRETGELTSAGLVIASGGNAGIAAAVAARAVGTTIIVVVPDNSPREKLARLERLGAHVTMGGAKHADSYERARGIAGQTGAFQLHAFDQVDVVAGAGTIALESLTQVPDLGSIVVAVGGGGLAAGVALVATAHQFRVIAVEPAGAPSLHAALAAGCPVDVNVDTIAQDSLGAARVGQIAYDVCSVGNTESVLVADSDIVTARQYLWSEYRLLVENSAAASVAAICAGAYAVAHDELPLIVLCGGNVSHTWPVAG